MRSLVQFAVFLAIVFFVVGEFLGGWYLGVPPQTPVYLYKKTTTATVSRRTQALQFPFSLEGRLSRGTLVVQGIFERPESVQNPGRQAKAPKVYFTKTFGAGDRINLAKVMKQGAGIYTLRFSYDDASGTLRIKVPPRSEL